jgi:hypothetical protein
MTSMADKSCFIVIEKHCTVTDKFKYPGHKSALLGSGTQRIPFSHVPSAEESVFPAGSCTAHSATAVNSVVHASCMHGNCLSWQAEGSSKETSTAAPIDVDAIMPSSPLGRFRGCLVGNFFFGETLL